MKANHARCFLLFVFLLFSIGAASQRKVLTDAEMVQQEVVTEIDAVFKSEAFLKKKIQKFNTTTGTMTIDIGVVQNGKVSTFFKVDDDIKNPLFTNFISDYILAHRFNFKLQKQQRYKIRYAAIF